MDEDRIISAVLNGDTEAFSGLVQAHQAKVRLICLGYLLNTSEADDAAQDVFLKAYESLSSYKGEASFSTWISRIASNHCLDLIRTRKRRQTDSLDALLEAHGDAINKIFSREDAGPYQEGERELLAKVLATLEEDERHILLLREVEELSYDEIASKLRCSLDAVKGRLKRAREHLEELGRRSFDTSTPLKRQ